MLSDKAQGFLTEAQRHHLSKLPDDISQEQLIQYFMLTELDLSIVPVRSPAYSRFGFALSLCSLRFLGFIPEQFNQTPDSITNFLLKQLDIATLPHNLDQYGVRSQTKSDHAAVIEKHLGFRRFNKHDQAQLAQWLLPQAMEHDRPTLLLKLLLGKLKYDKVIRPSLYALERLVSSVREQARQQTYRLLQYLLTNDRQEFLDRLLLVDEAKGKTLLTWLRQRAVSHSPYEICLTLEKIAFLEEANVPEWDLSVLNSNRLKFLSRLGKTSTNQALQRSVPEKRYPILIAFLHQALEELIDEVIDLFDQALNAAYSRSKNSLKRHNERVQENTNQKVRLLELVGTVILDEEVSDPELRHEVYRRIAPEILSAAVAECKKLSRPENDKCLDYFVKRFSYLRQFIPHFLKQLHFRSTVDGHPVLQAVDLLKDMNEDACRKVPDEAPTVFISDAWKPYIFQKNKIERRYYELCVLSELRNNLRSGEIWADGGRRYNNPEHYLIPRDQWRHIQAEAYVLLQLPYTTNDQLQKRKAEIDQLFIDLHNKIPKDHNLKIVDGQLVISPLVAGEEGSSLKTLRKLINSRLPKVGLTDILLEVDSWTNFKECFHHAGNQKANPAEFSVYLYAAILSEATNMGPTAMSDVTDLSYDRIVWYKNWYLRDETLEAAKTTLVNFQHQQVFAQHFGDGTFSSSDGRRVPVAVKTKTAKAFVKYFGYETGVNLYSWTSDQFAQFGQKATSPTMREATLVLDMILDNETELNIERHTTDTAGYTEIVFALFDLLGISFEPRIKNLGDQRIYCIGEKPNLSTAEKLASGIISNRVIDESWDDVVRLVASLKKGWVSASLFISKLQALPRKSNLAKALQEYGKIAKTISILRYAVSEELRREISTQLNKGEALHDLQQFLHLGREGRVYARQPDEQETHFGCLNLLINMVVVWNTVYMAKVIDQLKLEGHEISDDDLKHLSPARRGHINPYGKYEFDFDALKAGELRPLRDGS